MAISHSAIIERQMIEARGSGKIFVFYRDTDLYISRLLIKLLTMLESSHLRLRLWRHLADQTSHASLWTDHIGRLGLEELQCDPIASRKARPAPDQFDDAVDLLAEIIVVEEALLRSYESHSSLRAVDEATRSLLFRLIEDETWHIPSTRGKLAEVAASFGERRELADVLSKYRLAEDRLYQALKTRNLVLDAH